MSLIPWKELGMVKRVPFSNGTEVDWFRSGRCDICVNDHRDGGGCDEFAFGIANGDWPDLLRQVPTSAYNPLGIECWRFQMRR